MWHLLLSSSVCLTLLVTVMARPLDGSHYFPDAPGEDQIGEGVIPLGRAPPISSAFIRSILRSNLIHSNFQIYHSPDSDGRPARPGVLEHERRV